MKPASFTYVRPASLSEALRFLSDHPDAAKPLAGGQSLIPMLNLRLARVEYLVDVAGLPGLSAVAPVPDGGLVMGGMVRHQDLATSPVVAERAPLLAEAARLIGHPAIRNRGTLGGSVAHADPAAELPTALVALDAMLVLSSVDGERECPASEFFLALFITTLQPGELITAVRVPALQPRTGWAYLEMSRRHGDFAMVGVAAGVTLDPNGRCADVRLVFSGVADVPLRASAGEALLRGHELTPELLTEAAGVAVLSLDPPSDLHASGAFRREVARVYAQRALTLALGRAWG